MFYLFDLFGSFLPLHNPIGFGGADFIEFFLATALLAPALSRRFLTRVLSAVAPKTILCLLALFVLPIALRLAMLRVHPIPTPLSVDDSSYVLLGDTLAHLRFSNPPHALPQFFETIFVLQQPHYASVFQMGQGIALAIGEILFRNPWAGVAFSIGAMCAAFYWMLRGWTTPAWSLAGAIFAALDFGALSQWMNSFWGGAIAAIGGCIAFGALPRLETSGARKYAIVLGVGIGIEAVSRPYETVFLAIAVVLYFVPRPRVFLRAAPLMVAAALPAIGLTLVQNKSVTGSWTTLPYALSRYQYGVPTTFTWQPDPTPHRDLSPQQRLGFEVQKSTHDDQAAMGFFRRLKNRAFVWRFFWLAPLLIAAPFYLRRICEYRFAWVLAAIAIFAAGTNLYPYFYSHYVAAIACLFVLLFVTALESMPPAGAQVVIYFCVAHFAFWYGLHLAGNRDFASNLWQFETEDAINTGDPQGRAAIHATLIAAPGKHLVFVRYQPNHAAIHGFEEWVYNASDIDSSRIVWAHDLGAGENEKLRRYYPDRDAWLLEPDSQPPLLAPYGESPHAVPETVAPPQTSPTLPPPGSKKKPPRFEDIPIPK